MTKIKENIRKETKRADQQRRKGDHIQLIDTLLVLGPLHRDSGDENKAIDCLKEAVDLAQRMEKYFDASFAYRILAEIYAEMGNRELALQYVKSFRVTAEKSRSKGQIQLSFHVTGWVYERLWVNEHDPSNTEDLKEAYQWCTKSLEYLKQVWNSLDKESLKCGGSAERRRAMLNRLCSSIQANRGDSRSAEAHWRSAMRFAEDEKDENLKYELFLVKCDFPWCNAVETAQQLVNMSNKPKTKAVAMLELIQAKIYAGDFEGAYESALSCLADYGKVLESQIGDDFELLNMRLVFLTILLRRCRIASDSTRNARLRMRMYERIADSLFEYSADNRNLAEIGVDNYKKMLNLCTQQEDKCRAWWSLATTYAQLKEYEAGIEYFEQLRSVEKNPIKLLDIRCELFRCNVKRLAMKRCDEVKRDAIKENVLSEFRQLIAEIGAQYHSEISNLYSCLINYFDAVGDKNESDNLRREDEFREKNVEDKDDGIFPTSYSCDEDEDVEDVNTNQQKILLECRRRAEMIHDSEQIKRDINKVNGHGETELHKAARENNPMRLRKLLEAGYKVNKKDYGGWTPLAEAVSARLTENVRILVKAGADVNCSSLQNLETTSEDSNEVKKTGGGMTPLMEACGNLQFDIIRVLLSAGADVTKKNDDGWTAVDFLSEAIDELDEAEDRAEIVFAKQVKSELENRQAKAGFAVRRGKPPKRTMTSPTTRSKLGRKVKRRSFSPGKVNLNAYKSTMRMVGRKGPCADSAGDSDEEGRACEVDRNMTDWDDEPQPCSSHQVPSLRSPPSPSIDIDGDGDPVPEFTYTASLTSRASTSKSQKSDPFIVNDIRDRRKRKMRNSSSSPVMSARKRTSRRNNDFDDDDVSILDPPENPSPGSPLRTQSRSFIRRSPVRSADWDRGPLLDNTNTVSPFQSTPTATQSSRRGVTVAFFTSNNEKTREKMFSLPSSSTVSTIKTLCENELPENQHSFDLRLPGGCEIDIDFPICDLPPPVLIHCIQRPQTFEGKFRYSSEAPSEAVLKALKELDLSCRLDLSLVEADQHVGKLIGEIAGVSTIRQLTLDFCDLSTVNPSALRELLKSCEQFSARSCGISDSFLDKVISMSSEPFEKLASLCLSDNEFISGETIGNFLSRTCCLKNIELSSLSIESSGGRLVKEICFLNSLEHLNLAYSKWLSAELLEELLSKTEKLIYLNLACVNFGQLLFSPPWLPSLKKLIVSGCLFEDFDSFLEWIGLNILEYVDLSCTPLSTEHYVQLLHARKGNQKPVIVRALRCPIESDRTSLLEQIQLEGDLQNSPSPVVLQLSPPLQRYIKDRTAFANHYLDLK